MHYHDGEDVAFHTNYRGRNPARPLLFIGFDEKPRSIVVAIPNECVIASIEIAGMEVGNAWAIAAVCLL